MTLVMTLLVRDEADIVDAHIKYHLDQGVDMVIATDNRSEDGTTEILREHERQGHLEYIYEPADDYNQQKWVTRMARRAARKYAADWVINSDTDEFWWPLAGDLPECLAQIPPEIDVVPAPRVDFVPRPEGPGHVLERMTVREVQSTNAVGKPLLPKLAHRGHPDVVVGQGNHRIRKPQMTIFTEPSPLTILHFPLRSYAQFENKIVKGGAAYERNTERSQEAGRTWRHLYELWKEGELPMHYAARRMSDADVVAGLAAGDLVDDHRLVDHLRHAGILP